MKQVNNSFLWVVLAFLLGISIFGIYKSLELSRKNAELSQALNDTKTELTGTQIALKGTESRLRSSDAKNAELTKDTEILKTKLVKVEEGLFAHQKSLDRLRLKLKMNAEARASLQIDNARAEDQLTRLTLENAEMKKTLSSVVELKRAIRELKKKPKKEETRKATEKPLVWLWKNPPEKPVEEPIEGNEGFFIKDGQSTFSKIVNIKVIPVEPAAQ